MGNLHTLPKKGTQKYTLRAELQMFVKENIWKQWSETLSVWFNAKYPRKPRSYISWLQIPL